MPDNVHRCRVKIGKRNVVFDAVTGERDFDRIANVSAQDGIANSVNAAANADISKPTVNHASSERVFYNFPFACILCRAGTSGENEGCHQYDGKDFDRSMHVSFLSGRHCG